MPSMETLLCVSAFDLHEELSITVPAFFPFRPLLTISGVVHPKIEIDVTLLMSQTLALDISLHIVSVDTPFTFFSFFVLFAGIEVLRIIRGNSKVMDFRNFSC